jgi:hypothetical protein
MSKALESIASLLTSVTDDIVGSRANNDSFDLENWQDALIKCRSARIQIEALVDRVGELGGAL